METIHQYLCSNPTISSQNDLNLAASITYYPGGVMPQLLPYIGQLIEIRIASKYLVLQNPEVTSSKLWGGIPDEELLSILSPSSDAMVNDDAVIPESVMSSLATQPIYTDDSDAVAILHHSALFPLRTVAPPFAGLALVCRVLPALPRYSAYTHPTSRYSSRAWAGQYDKCSLAPVDAYPLSDSQLLNASSQQQQQTVAQAMTSATGRRARGARASTGISSTSASGIPLIRMTSGPDGFTPVGVRPDEDAAIAAALCASEGNVAQLALAEDSWAEEGLVTLPTGDMGVRYDGGRLFCGETECGVEEMLCKHAVQCFVVKDGEWTVYELRRTKEVPLPTSDSKNDEKKYGRVVVVDGEDDEGLSVPYVAPPVADDVDEDDDTEVVKSTKTVKTDIDEEDDEAEQEQENSKEKTKETAKQDAERAKEREKQRERKREQLVAARAATALHATTRALYSWTRMAVRVKNSAEVSSANTVMIRSVPALWDEQEYMNMRAAAAGGGSRKRGRASKDITTAPCLDTLPGFDKKASTSVLEYFDKCVIGGVTGLDTQSVLTIACAASSVERGAGNIEETLVAEELRWEDILWCPTSVYVNGIEYGEAKFLRFVRF